MKNFSFRFYSCLLAVAVLLSAASAGMAQSSPLIFYPGGNSSVHGAIGYDMNTNQMYVNTSIGTLPVSSDWTAVLLGAQQDGQSDAYAEAYASAYQSAISQGAGSSTGAGTLTLNGNNTYDGATLVSGGTLQMGSGYAAEGTIAYVSADGTLSLDGASNYTTILSGSLSLSDSGYDAGFTKITGGTLQLDSGAVLTVGGVTNPVVNGDFGCVLVTSTNHSVYTPQSILTSFGTVTFDGTSFSVQYTATGFFVPTPLAGSSTMQFGSANLTLTAAGVTLSGSNYGTLQVVNGSLANIWTALSGSASVVNGGTLSITGGRLYTFAGTSGTSVAVVSGTATLPNGSVFTGGTLLFSGGCITTGTTLGNQPMTAITGGNITLAGGTTTLPTPVAGQNVVAMKGDPAVGIAGARFASVGFPAINDNLCTAFLGSVMGLSSSASRVIGVNNMGIWADDQFGDRQLVARKGSVAPGTTGATFVMLDDPVYNNNEAVAFEGMLSGGDVVSWPLNNSHGIWSNDGGTLHLVARTGQQAPGCAPGAVFSAFSRLVLPDQGGVTNQGGVVVLANLSGTGTTMADNQGIWAVDTTGTLQLIVRKGDTHPVTGKKVIQLAFLTLPINSEVDGQTRGFSQATAEILYKAAFADGTWGVFKCSPGSSVPSAIVSRNDPAVGISGAKFASVGFPAINDNSRTAFLGLVTGLSSSAVRVIGVNNMGIWADDQTGVRQLVVQKGSVAPGTAGALFALVGEPVYNNNESVAFEGMLSGGDVVSWPFGNSRGIWSNDGGTLHLVARTGQQAPGCAAGTVFTIFSKLVLPDQGGAANRGGVILLAGLNGVGATMANNQGIWAVDTSGNLQLIVRKGDTHPLNGKKITQLSFLALPNNSEVGGQTRGFAQETGDILYKASFSDGTWGVFKCVFP